LVAWTSRLAWMLPAITCAWAVPARAEGDRALSAGLGWATFSTPGKKMGNMEPPAVTPDVGGTLSVMYEHAISSELSLRGELAGAVFTGGQTGNQSPRSYSAIGDVGVLFRFDVLKYVPYAFGGVGGALATGGPIDKGNELVIVVGGGLDVLASRSRSFGVEGRLASFGGSFTVFTLGVRGSVRWGYF
jgi:hypothetical protein